MRDEVTKLKSALADKALENDFFASALLKIKEILQQNLNSGASAFYAVIQSRAQEQGTAGIERMCQLAGVNRASYYRHWEAAAPEEAEMAARAAIQKVVLTHQRRYGYRRVTVDLHRQGMVINHKRVLRSVPDVAGDPSLRFGQRGRRTGEVEPLGEGNAAGEE